VLAGLAVFGAGSLGGGLAPGAHALVGARIVQGTGAALLLPGTLAVVSRAYEQPAERARAIGIWAAISATALPAGVVGGGALVEGPGWRWAFLVNLPIVAVAFAVALLVVRETRGPSERAPDAAGTALTAGSWPRRPTRSSRPLRSRAPPRSSCSSRSFRSSAASASRCCRPRSSAGARSPPRPSLRAR
jgi:MFS family permease